MDSLPARSEVPLEQTWDLGDLFAGDGEWEVELAAVGADLPGLAGWRGRVADSPASLVSWLQAWEPLAARMERLLLYAMLGYSVDTSDQAAQARQQRVRGLAARLAAAAAFAEPEMIAAGPERLLQWTEQEPALAAYRHRFEVLAKRAPHVRSAEVEELLGQARAPLGAAAGVHGVLADADLRFAPARGTDGSGHVVTQGTIARLLTDPDREVRRTAWEGYADAHLAFARTMAACVTAGVERQVFSARARRYGSALEAAMDGAQVPLNVFHDVLRAFQANLGTWHRYWRVRRRLLGYDELHPYDERAPLSGTSPAVPYDRAVDWIAESVRPLGDRYVTVLRHGATGGRWVDARLNLGKRKGAFSAGGPDTHPFVFMSYGEDVFAMSTLAHELGHAMHSFHSRASQPYVYARYGLFVAEVASNFHQALVRDHLLRTVDEPGLRLALVEEAMSNFLRYFLVMPALARFEQEIHARVEAGRALTADGMTSQMADLLEEAYGGEMVVDRDRLGITWAQFHTHLCRDFYEYQYATGIACAHALAADVSSGDEEAAERYLRFLRAGDSLFPLDALRLAGVDLASPEPIERGFEVMAGYVDRLEELAEMRAGTAPAEPTT